MANFEINGFDIPVWDEIRDRMLADLAQSIPGFDTRLRHTAIAKISEAISGAIHETNQFIAFLVKQSFPISAEKEYLDYWGATWGIARKNATTSIGTTTFTGQNDSIIQTGTPLARGDGTTYVTTTAGTISSGSATVGVEALTEGSIGNATEGSQLSLKSPIYGINPISVASALTGGTEIETDDDYRIRLLARIQNAPHGGTAADYIAWGLEVPGVTQVYVYPLELGDGTVVVRFLMENTYADGIPLSGDVATVQAHINGERPVTAIVTVIAPVKQLVNITISNLTPSDDATKANVVAELKDMFSRESTPGGTIYVSKIWESVSTATGEKHHLITTPSADVAASDANHIPQLGTITYS